MKTTRVSGPMDPIATATDVVVTKQYTYTGLLGAEGTLVISSSSIATAFPNVVVAEANYTPFDRFRLIKISVFGETGDEYVGLLVQNSQVQFGDQAHFIDYGTAGSRRPVIHVSPAFDIRSAWNNATNGIALFTVYGTPNTRVVLQLTVEIRSTSGQNTPAPTAL